MCVQCMYQTGDFHNSDAIYESICPVMHEEDAYAWVNSFVLSPKYCHGVYSVNFYSSVNFYTHGEVFTSAYKDV